MLVTMKLNIRSTVMQLLSYNSLEGDHGGHRKAPRMFQ